METPPDAVLAQCVYDGLAVFHPNDLEVMHRRRIRVDVQRPALAAGEELAVLRRSRAPCRVPAVEALELDGEDRGLERVEAAVDS